MIEQVTITGYKCFKNTILTLSKSNLLLGANSGGKSSFIQALLLSKLLLEEKKVDLNNNRFNLDLISFEEIINTDAEIIEFKITNTEKQTLKIVCNSSEDNNLLLAKIDGDIDVLNCDITYLSAERSINKEQITGDITNLALGKNNEHLAYVIEKGKLRKNIKIHQNRSHWLNKEVNLLDFQVNQWLNYILPNNSVNSTFRYDNKYSLLFGDYGRRQVNIGFGVAFILPIIIAGLIAPKKSILIIENPELHLHPAPQSRIAEFLNVVAMDGVQIIVETHSDHIVNGFRKSILKKEIDIEFNDITINYFTNFEHLSVDQIKLNKEAEIVSWPSGFMDQVEEDLMELRKLRRNL